MASPRAPRLAFLGSLSETHCQQVTPIVADWTARADALSAWVGTHATASTLPITVLVTPLKPVNPQ